MKGYDNQGTRVEIESTRYQNGRLLATVTGLAGERFEDIPVEEPHGFHARPAKGATGFVSAPGGRRDQAVIRMAHDPAKVPQLEEGESALYDGGGNMVKVTSAGVEITHSGAITINGNLTVNGTLHATGDITSGAPDGDEE